MVKQLTLVVLLAALVAPGLAAAADDDSSSGNGGGAGDPAQILGGKQGNACMMLLCLSDPQGKQLKECQKPLEDYYDMKPKRRPGYLASCPQVK
ncbi:hypothetical protein [Pseudomonas sp.]|uniref:hypothetical protein n=1 Tax=Pseudomonas sp. TaxID=306 RepID=UPI0029144EA6|nr:hypothetical protein [Pseudomonas sp.]MDU4254432.1 hypothetical protein [Pseudomonas sp.]